jgi:hypothetical protein
LVTALPEELPWVDAADERLVLMGFRWLGAGNDGTSRRTRKQSGDDVSGIGKSPGWS